MSHTGNLPTVWSEWELDPKHNRWERYRLDANGNYEFQYGNAQSPQQPRSLAPFNSMPGQTPSVQYSSQSNYTTDVPALTQNFSQISVTQAPHSYLQQGVSQGQGIEQEASVLPGTNVFPIQRGVQKSSGPTHIVSPETREEEFDPHYQVHHSREFRWGRVFKVVWTEPRGDNSKRKEGSLGTTEENRGADGKQQFQKVRRFVIVNPMEGHCICLPINTYNGQGTMKKGVHAKHHTIVYSEDKPVALSGEKKKGMVKAPIKIKCGQRHKLDRASRMNYTKQYTVEYNVKVWFIGQVDPKSHNQLIADYNKAHPLLQPREASPLAEDTFSYAQGGESSSTINQSSQQATYHLSQTSQAPSMSPENSAQGTGWENRRPDSGRSTTSGRGFGSNTHGSGSYDNRGGPSNYRGYEDTTTSTVGHGVPEPARASTYDANHQYDAANDATIPDDPEDTDDLYSAD